MEILLTNYSFIALTISIILRLFQCNIKYALIAYACALGVALGQDYVEPIGFVIILIILLVLYLNNQKNLDKLIKIALWVFILVVGFNLVSHNLPGFNNIQLVFEKLSGSKSYYNLWIHYDSIFFGVAIFIFNYKNISFSNFNKNISFGLLSSLLITPLLSLFAIRIGVGEYERFIPQYFSYWVWVMALYALVAESFFCMFIIGGVLGNKPYKSLHAIVMILFSSFLFSYQYLERNIELMQISFVSGILYSTLYLYAGKRVEVSFVAHFVMNIVQLIFFASSFLVF